LARHSKSLLELARLGAEHRFRQLKEDVAALMKDFPHLRYVAVVR
jgi:hypothetical protein